MLLDDTYPITKCYLDYEKPYELLFATIMSAQCTDAQVNKVTKELFKKFPRLEDYAAISPEILEPYIHSTGFFHTKAKNIIECAKKLLTDYDGQLPSDIETLTTFPGVGRKTANVIRSHIFNIPSIVVDTHVKRVSFRLGMTKQTDPDKIEFDLMRLLPENYWIRYNTQIIAHGRAVCQARGPRCDGCIFNAHRLCERKGL